MENKTIFECLKEACSRSTLNMLDINPNYFFGEVVPYPIPFDDGDILDYISSLTDGFMESEYKMVLYNGTVTKLDIDMQDCMIDTEDIECYPLAILESYEEMVRLCYSQGQKDFVYLISKDYDANDDTTTYSLSRLLKIK